LPNALQRAFFASAVSIVFAMSSPVMRWKLSRVCCHRASYFLKCASSWGRSAGEEIEARKAYASFAKQ